MLIVQLYIPFGETSVHVLCHFLNELMVFEMTSFESSSRTLSTSRLLECKHFLSDVSRLFILFSGSFTKPVF